MAIMAPTFSKQERIVSKQLMETLFEKGNSLSLSAYPLRVIYKLTTRHEGSAPVQILISVPKRKFKHAVDRNRVKRQVREAYRHHKQSLWESVPNDRQLLVAFLWLSDKHAATQEVEKRVISLLKHIEVKSCVS